MVQERRPQINFQVEPSLKTLYEQARVAGHWVTRLCAAGLLHMIENPESRRAALARLIAWEAQYADASDDEIFEFVQGAQAAMRAATPGTKRARKAPPSQKKPKRG
jgi:hypothetical protein